MSGVRLGGDAEVVVSNLARGKIFTASLYISNQIWCVSYSREWGVQQHTFFAQLSGVKRSKLNFQL